MRKQKSKETRQSDSDLPSDSSLKSTILLLTLTFIAVPVVSYYFDKPLNDLQINTLRLLLKICGSFAVLVFVVSTLTKNYSQVDKLWTVMPVLYAWLITWYGNWHPRLLLASFLITVWGARLSYNFARKGGYRLKFWEGEEDYRWPVVRQNPIFANPVVWVIFNLLFISFYQMGLLLIIDAPLLVAMESSSQSSLNLLDVLTSGLILGFIIMETVADEQQWEFQTRKQKWKKDGGHIPIKYTRGFLTEGLFAYSRHPNYFAEQAIWVSVYLFSVAATGRWVNWSLVGAILLVLLFQGSADLTEKISLSKYPRYRGYMKRVPKFIPKLSKD